MARHRTIRSQIWSVSSAGPFTTTGVVASNLSVGSGVVVIFLLAGSPGRVSALSGQTTRVRIRPVMRDGWLEGPTIISRFPVAFPPPAFRFSVIRFPLGGWAFLTVGLPASPDPDGVTAFPTHELRPGWVPSIPRGRRCSSRLRGLLSRRLPLYHG
jgi:hypothetical protein